MGIAFLVDWTNNILDTLSTAMQFYVYINTGLIQEIEKIDKLADPTTCEYV